MAQDQASPKVLVVDDNAENRALAQATLEDEGYEVLLAGSGEEAPRPLRGTRPRLRFARRSHARHGWLRGVLADPCLRSFGA